MMEKEYKRIIEPSEFIKEFKSKKEFVEWLELGTIKELESCLKAFEDAELYEHCAIILNEIKNYENNRGI